MHATEETQKVRSLQVDEFQGADQSNQCGSSNEASESESIGRGGGEMPSIAIGHTNFALRLCKRLT